MQMRIYLLTQLFSPLPFFVFLYIDIFQTPRIAREHQRFTNVKKMGRISRASDRSSGPPGARP